MGITLEDLYYKYLALGHEKQKKLQEILAEDSTYTIDFDNAILSFDTGLKLSFEIIATHSTEENSWLWIWGNEQWNRPIMEDAKSLWLKEFGKKNSISVFEEPLIGLGGNWSASDVARICSALCDSGAYFRYPYDYGAAFLLIEPCKELDEATIEDMSFYHSCITDCWNLFDDGANKEITESYLKIKNIPYTYEGNKLISEFGGSKMVLEFDTNNYAIGSTLSLN